ncbi:MAG: hypothetical protein R3F34_09090 [Planctomycetota bacterium]
MTRDRDDGGPILIVFAALALLLILSAAAFFLLRAAPPAPVVVRATPVPVPTAPSRPVAELASEGSGATELSVHDTSIERRPTERSTDVVTWADLVTPVDASNGAAVDGVALRVVDAEGALRSIEWDAVVFDGDLAEGRVAFLVHDDYVTRPFLPVDLARRDDVPVLTELRPTASIRFERSDPHDVTVPWPSLAILPLDPGGPILGLDEGFARSIARLTSDTTSTSIRRSEARRLLRRPDVVALLDLSAAAPNWQRVATPSGDEGAAFEIQDVPSGVPLRIAALESDATATLTIPGAPPEVREFGSSLFTGRPLEPHERYDVLVSFANRASVRGRIGGVSKPVQVVLASMSDERVAKITYFEGTDAEGFFSFERLEAGHYVLSCDLESEDASRVILDRKFDLAAGEQADLGLVEPTYFTTLRLVPELVIDGVVEPSLLSGADLGTVLVCSLTRTGGGEPRSMTFRSLDAATVRGIEPGHYTVTTHVMSPKALRTTHRSVGIGQLEVDVPIDGAELTVPVELESVSPVDLVVRFPSSGGRSTSVSRPIAIDRTNDRLVEGERSTESVLEPNGRRSVADAMFLPAGEWTVLVHGESWTEGVADGRDVLDLVGSASVVVRPTTRVTVEVDLVVGARALLSFEKSADPEAAASCRIAAAPWSGFGLEGAPTDPEGRTLLERLLPNTEYVIEPLGLRFTTGAPGTTVEVTAH